MSTFAVEHELDGRGSPERKWHLMRTIADRRNYEHRNRGKPSL